MRVTEVNLIAESCQIIPVTIIRKHFNRLLTPLQKQFQFESERLWGSHVNNILLSWLTAGNQLPPSSDPSHLLGEVMTTDEKQGETGSHPENQR